jgi:kinesin family protein 6/9
VQTIAVHTKPDARDVVNNGEKRMAFQYDRVLHNASQEAVYDSLARDLVSGAVMNGINGTIICYGQTGSGKSYSMIGDPSSYKNRGIAPRGVTNVFQAVQEKPEIEFSLAVSYLEIYNDKIYDLLEKSRFADIVRGPFGQTQGVGAGAGAGAAAGSPDYTIVEDPVNGVTVRGLTMIPVSTEEEAMSALFAAEAARVKAEHSLNRASNRSHCVFTVHIRQRSRLSGGKERITVSKLHFVDLAGSERLKKTLLVQDPASGRTISLTDDALAQESMSINRSLTYLEQCIVALTSKKPRSHIPYRQTALTSLLRDALGGNSATVFVACVWPESRHVEESISTLRLAHRMMSVHNEPTIGNAFVDEKELIKQYERTITNLRQELLMHDALSDRSGVSYGEYTPEQQAALSAKLMAFVRASTETQEREALPLESVQQMRELLKLAKLAMTRSGLEAEERLRGQYILVPKDAAASAQGAAALGALLSGQSFPLPAFGSAAGASAGFDHGPPTTRPGTVVGDSAAAAAGGVGRLEPSSSGVSLGLASAAAKPPTQILPMHMASMAAGSGSPVRSAAASPHATGSAAAGGDGPASPGGSAFGISGLRISTDNSPASSPWGHTAGLAFGARAAASPSRNGYFDQSSGTPGASRGGARRGSASSGASNFYNSSRKSPERERGVAFELTSLSLPPEANELWREYRRTAGLEAEEALNGLRATLADRRAKHALAAKEVNTIKSRIDGLVDQLRESALRRPGTSQGGRPTTAADEDARLQADLQAAKAAYRAAHERFNDVRARASAVASEIDQRTGLMVRAFQAWSATAAAAALLKGTGDLGAGLGGSGVFRDTGASISAKNSFVGDSMGYSGHKANRGDILDEGEAFDYLQRERVLAATADPGSVAYFNATRRARIRMHDGHATSPSPPRAMKR